MVVTLIPRSERLALPIPITYRIPGDDHWINSRVLNISDSGVLFGPTALNPGTPVEVIFLAPRNIGTLGSGKQMCAAEVVRTTDSGDAAVRFEECRFLLDS
jgi:PilZ domain